MLKYYIKTALRNFQTNKVIFAGSLLTLILGSLSISLLSNYLFNELTMDNFHSKEKDMYMMKVKFNKSMNWMSFDASHYYGFNFEDFPELKCITSIKKFEKKELKLAYGNSTFQPEVLIADSTFFQVFDFDLKIGNKNQVLFNPQDILITENYAKKMFGAENPIGKTVKLLGNYNKLYTVNGIMKNLPSNSSILFDVILPTHSDPIQRFGRTGGDFFVLNKDVDENEFIEKIENFIHTKPYYKNYKVGLVPFDDLYLNKDEINVVDIISKFGNKRNNFIVFFIIIVLFIITTLNFSNLQVIYTNSNIKLLGINIVHGAQSKHLIFQKIIEIGIIIIVTTVIISSLYQLLLPAFNTIINVPLSPPIWMVVALNLSVLLLIAFLALFYPMIVTTKIPVLSSLKNQLFSIGNSLSRKTVVTLQYTLTFILLIAAIVVAKQLNMMLDKDLGFNYENIISSKLFSYPHESKFYEKYEELNDEQKIEFTNNITKNHHIIQNELASNTLIKSFSQGDSPLKPIPSAFKLKSSDDKDVQKKLLRITPNHKEIFGLQITEGRFFENSRDKPSWKKAVINEAAKKFWNIKDITKDRLQQRGSMEYEIIGVVKDFNYEHLATKPEPLVMVYYNDIESPFYIEFQDGQVERGLKFVKILFHKTNLNETFHYSFLSDEIADLYQKEKRLSTIYILFTIIALTISAIGLFTIALYETRRRIKEVALRRVNGASIKEIVSMLNKDFIKWVGIAFVIAVPITYYAMSKWLENFAYKTTLSWWVFALAGVFTLVIALLTVSWQSYRAATRNPVEALRDE